MLDPLVDDLLNSLLVHAGDVLVAALALGGEDPPGCHGAGDDEQGDTGPQVGVDPAGLGVLVRTVEEG